MTRRNMPVDRRVRGVPRVKGVGWLSLAAVALLVTLGGCAGRRHYTAASNLAAAREWDQAVVEYTRALMKEPGNGMYRAELARALHEAAYVHIKKGQDLARKQDWKGALIEYEKAREYDPSNQFLAQLTELATTAMAAAPPQTQPVARPEAGPPVLKALPQTPVKLDMKSASPKDILRALGKYADINFVFDEAVTDKPVSITLENVIFEQALTSVMLTTHNFYRIIDNSTILIAPDNAMKRRQIEQLQVRTFYVSNAELADIQRILQQVVGANVVGLNNNLSAITVRDTPAKLDVVEKVLRANDKSRAEVLLELDIVEINRQRVHQFGLDLGTKGGSEATTFSGAFSPDGSTTGTIRGRDFLTANSLDYVFTLPTAAYKILLTDSDSKIIANPKLRGVEGKPMSLKMGDRVPIPVTTFTPIAGGGAAQQPITSFQYENIGINIDITPKVHRNNEITMDMKLDISSISGTGFGGLPTFGNRQVTATMRLREGESNLLGGLLREEERKFLSGIPGIKDIPLLGKLFSYNDNRKTQTDIILSLTPHIIRLPEISDQDKAPIWVGTLENPSPWGPLPQMRERIERPSIPIEEGAEPGGPGRPGPRVEPAEEEEPEEELPEEEPQAGGAAVSLSPTSSEVSLDSEFSIALNISGASNVGVANLTIRYDPDLLSITDANVQEGGFMRGEGGSTSFWKRVSPGTGTIEVGITRTAPKGASGSGNLVTLVFTAVGEGAGAVQVDRATFQSAQYQPIAVDTSSVADVEVYSEEEEPTPEEEEQ